MTWCVHARPTGLIRIDFYDGEEFRWNPLVTIVQHIILGTHYLDHNGTLHIQSSAARHASRIRFKEPFIAFTSKQVHQVREKHRVSSKSELRREGVQAVSPLLPHQ